MLGGTLVAGRGLARLGAAVAVAGLLGGSWLAGGRPTEASRFGPPWQASLIGDQAVAYTTADAGSAPAGPLARGDVVAVLEEVKGADGRAWVRTSAGFLPAESVAEKTDPWVGEAAGDVELRVRPEANADVMRTGAEGDLFRVMGATGSLDGGATVWWATTEGYLPVEALRRPTNEWAQWWNLPAVEEATAGFWGEATEPARVRIGGALDAPVVGRLAVGDHVKVLREEQGEAIDGDTAWYRIDGGRFAGAYVHASTVRRIADPQPNTTRPEGVNGNTYIVVDRQQKTLTFVRDDQPIFATYVAVGTAGKETPAGVYATQGKLRADTFRSSTLPDATVQYDYPNVPFTQYYAPDGGFALHGNYWHEQFGTERSQGCINLTTTDAAYLFTLTRPDVAPGTEQGWSPPETATPVVILE